MRLNHDRRSSLKDDVVARGASDHSLKGGGRGGGGREGTWCILTRRRIIVEMI